MKTKIPQQVIVSLEELGIKFKYSSLGGFLIYHPQFDVIDVVVEYVKEHCNPNATRIDYSVGTKNQLPTTINIMYDIEVEM